MYTVFELYRYLHCYDVMMSDTQIPDSILDFHFTLIPTTTNADYIDRPAPYATYFCLKISGSRRSPVETSILSSSSRVEADATVTAYSVGPTKATRRESGATAILPGAYRSPRAMARGNERITADPVFTTSDVSYSAMVPRTGDSSRVKQYSEVTRVITFSSQVARIFNDLSRVAQYCAAT